MNQQEVQGWKRAYADELKAQFNKRLLKYHNELVRLNAREDEQLAEFIGIQPEAISSIQGGLYADNFCEDEKDEALLSLMEQNSELRAEAEAQREEMEGVKAELQEFRSRNLEESDLMIDKLNSFESIILLYKERERAFLAENQKLCKQLEEIEERCRGDLQSSASSDSSHNQFLAQAERIRMLENLLAEEREEHLSALKQAESAHLEELEKIRQQYYQLCRSNAAKQLDQLKETRARQVKELTFCVEQAEQSKSKLASQLEGLARYNQQLRQDLADREGQIASAEQMLREMRHRNQTLENSLEEERAQHLLDERMHKDALAVLSQKLQCSRENQEELVKVKQQLVKAEEKLTKAEEELVKVRQQVARAEDKLAKAEEKLARQSETEDRREREEWQLLQAELLTARKNQRQLQLRGYQMEQLLKIERMKSETVASEKVELGMLLVEVRAQLQEERQKQCQLHSTMAKIGKISEAKAQLEKYLTLLRGLLASLREQAVHQRENMTRLLGMLSGNFEQRLVSFEEKNSKNSGMQRKELVQEIRLREDNLRQESEEQRLRLSKKLEESRKECEQAKRRIEEMEDKLEGVLEESRRKDLKTQRIVKYCKRQLRSAVEATLREQLQELQQMRHRQRDWEMEVTGLSRQLVDSVEQVLAKQKEYKRSIAILLGRLEQMEREKEEALRKWAAERDNRTETETQCNALEEQIRVKEELIQGTRNELSALRQEAEERQREVKALKVGLIEKEGVIYQLTKRIRNQPREEERAKGGQLEELKTMIKRTYEEVGRLKESAGRKGLYSPEPERRKGLR